MYVRPEEPLISIGACSRLIGVPEATLRVWERRYNFPNSSRTSGGHRLYSQEEVLRLAWVKARLAEGMQVSQAIRALRHAEETQTLRSGPPMPVGGERTHEDNALVSILQRRLRDVLFQRLLEEARLVIGEALALYSIEDIIFQMIVPTLQDIGESWASRNLAVTTEHLATNYLRQCLLTWLRLGPPAYAVKPVVLACAPGELHEGGLLALGVLLRRLRWPVLYLGQTMPLSDLLNLIVDLSPSVVVFVAMTEETGRALADWPQGLKGLALGRLPVIGYGGRAFVTHPELIEAVPGVFLGQTLQEGIEKLDRMLRDMHPRLA